jgi:hypothetical protein
VDLVAQSDDLAARVLQAQMKIGATRGLVIGLSGPSRWGYEDLPVFYRKLEETRKDRDQSKRGKTP